MTDIPASLADLDNPDREAARNEPSGTGPQPADRPHTAGSSALAPVVKIGGRRQAEPLTELMT